MYRRLEPKPEKIHTKDPSPETNCKCTCTLEQSDEQEARPDISLANAYSADYVNHTG